MTKTITLAATVYERYGERGWISADSRVIPGGNLQFALDRIEQLEATNDQLLDEVNKAREAVPADGPIKSSIPCELVAVGDAMVQPSRIVFMAFDPDAQEVVVKLDGDATVYVKAHVGKIEADILADLTYRVNKSITDAHRRIYEGKS